MAFGRTSSSLHDATPISPLPLAVRDYSGPDDEELQKARCLYLVATLDEFSFSFSLSLAPIIYISQKAI
jgi:hypothetical protein